VHDEFFERDKEINAREKDIRRRIVEHLSLRHDVDVPACLVLMSVVKDAERIGDYSKNIYEVACLYTMGFRTGPYVLRLKQLRTEVEGFFDKVRAVFAEADGLAALVLIQQTKEVGWRADQMIERLIRDELPTQKAVAFALLSRYFKRVAAHLGNICTSVTGPVHEMDHTPQAEQRIRKTYGSRS